MKYRQLCSLLLLASVEDSAAIQLDSLKLSSRDNQLVQLDENSEEIDDSVIEGTDVIAKNIYGIPDEDEKKLALT